MNEQNLPNELERNEMEIDAKKNIPEKNELEEDSEKNIPEENKLEEDREKDIPGKNAGQFEKIFWITLIFFALIYAILSFLADQNNPDIKKSTYKNKPVLEKTVKTIIEIVDDNETIKNNLENSRIIKLIEKNLELKKENMHLLIENKVNQAFLPVYNNIETFLDFHYSVIGEYSELTAAATGEIGKSIKNKLFGNEFDIYLEQTQNQINSAYIEKLKDHIKYINNLALNNINLNLNSEILLKLDQDIEQRFTVQKIKVGSILGTAAAIKIVSIVSGKIAVKAGSKIAAKSAAKITTKSTAAAGAAATGTLCGPLAWICAPVAATIAWVGTDAVVVTADEYLTRDEFKQEIITMIDKQKYELIDKMKSSYSEQFSADSAFIQDSLKNTIIKKEVKKTIIEKINN